MTSKNRAIVEQFDMPHPGGGLAVQISVLRPALAAEGRRIPVLLVLDGDVEFAVAAEITRFNSVGGLRPTPIVVGIGYGITGLAALSEQRAIDLTPPQTGDENIAAVPHAKSGGAQILLDFILHALMPEIRRRYPEAASGEPSLFGHSLGGLFAVYALLRRPDAFAAILAVSPALYWDDFGILSRLPDFGTALTAINREPRVFLCCGGTEQDPPTWLPRAATMTLADARALIARCRMVDAMREFATSLRGLGLSEVTSVVFEAEDHLSVIPSAMMRAIRFAFGNGEEPAGNRAASGHADCPGIDEILPASLALPQADYVTPVVGSPCTI